jgi:hypothetical protein
MMDEVITTQGILLLLLLLLILGNIPQTLNFLRLEKWETSHKKIMFNIS